MTKKQRNWIYACSAFLLATGLIHSISLFVTPVALNETEKTLLDLMTNYKRDMGAGFHPSMADLFTALSSCFSLVCFLGGLLLVHFGRKNPEPGMLTGVLNIYLLIFGLTFAVMAWFTFLPPIVLTGIAFVSLIFTRIAFRPAAAGE